MPRCTSKDQMKDGFKSDGSLELWGAIEARAGATELVLKKVR